MKTLWAFWRLASPIGMNVTCLQKWSNQRIGVNDFPCKSPLFDCKFDLNPFLKMKVIICRFGSSYEENGLSAQ
jgi:hypothetical protein